MKTLQSKLWDQKAEIYSKMASSEIADSYEYEINFPSILRLLPQKASKVLDLGCGNGVFTKKLAERFNNIIGTDVSPNMIDICKHSFPSIKFQVLDLESEFKLEEGFDLIVCKLVLMFVNDIDNMASESFKALDQGGHLIISVPHPAYWLTYYLQNKYGVKERTEFNIMENGYFSEKLIHRSIGGNKDLEFDFKFRTLGTYLNTFSKAGFCLKRIEEPILTKEFLNKYPEENNKADIPMRLNILFKKP